MSACLIFATPRSGSYLLCEDLTSTGVAGSPQEYLASDWRALALKHGLDPLTDTARYLDLLVAQRSTPNGLFAIKVMWQHFVDLSDRLEVEVPQLGPTGTLLDYLLLRCRAVRVVWMRRRDKVGQAISYWRAVQTGQWSRYSAEPEPPDSVPCYDYAAIRELGRQIAEEEGIIAAYLSANELSVLTVWYEDLDSGRRAATQRVLEHLGLRIPTVLVVPARPLVRQADTLTDQWRSRFLQDFEREHGTDSG